MGKKVLLTTVFKPFAIDDLYSRKENIPELMMSQITRVQGLFSYRAWHANSGLHMIAANCGAPATVLEWPSIDEFKNEIVEGNYDFIGISFIPSTLLKMREMTKTIRKFSPKSKIIIGGYGTMIPDIESIADADYICDGEGIRYLRNLLEFPEVFKFHHPTVKSYIVEFLGMPITSLQVGQIVTGLGCQYGCEFCMTSAFFKCQYQPFLSSGTELYHLIKEQNTKEKIKSFWIIDENFLLNRNRAIEFRETIANDDILSLPDFTIDMIWSSSDNIESYNPEFLAEMGITRLWIGYESKFSNYKKNRKINIAGLIDKLKEFGISTLLSCTMFRDEHNEQTWEDEKNEFISLGQAFSQFLPLTAFPGTSLYKKMVSENRFLHSIPWEEQHALTTSSHKHPAIPIWKQESLVIDAYMKEYERNGPSQIRDLFIRTRGYETFKNSDSPILKKRAIFLKEHLKNQAPWLLASKNFVVERHQQLVMDTIEELKRILGNENMKKANEISKFITKIISAHNLKEKSKPVIDREPGLRMTKYNGCSSDPLEVRNPKTW
jgi:hypothetical protein